MSKLSTWLDSLLKEYGTTSYFVSVRLFDNGEHEIFKYGDVVLHKGRKALIINSNPNFISMLPLNKVGYFIVWLRGISFTKKRSFTSKPQRFNQFLQKNVWH